MCSIHKSWSLCRSFQFCCFKIWSSFSLGSSSSSSQYHSAWKMQLALGCQSQTGISFIICSVSCCLESFALDMSFTNGAKYVTCSWIRYQRYKSEAFYLVSPWHQFCSILQIKGFSRISCSIIVVQSCQWCSKILLTSKEANDRLHERLSTMLAKPDPVSFFCSILIKPLDMPYILHLIGERKKVEMERKKQFFSLPEKKANIIDFI